MSQASTVQPDYSSARQSLSPAELFAVDSSLITDVRLGLARVETLLRRVADDAPAGVDRLVSYLIRAGGKRFRPGIVLVAAQFGNDQNDDVVKAAVVCELVHVASAPEEQRNEESR